MSSDSGCPGYGNPQCVKSVCEPLGELSLYGHNQSYKTYDVREIVEYPAESLALVEDRADGWINVEDKAPELQQSVAFIVDSRPGSDYNGKVYGGKYLGYNFGEHEFVLPGICFSAKLWQPLPPPPNPTITKTP